MTGARAVYIVEGVGRRGGEGAVAHLSHRPSSEWREQFLAVAHDCRADCAPTLAGDQIVVSGPATAEDRLGVAYEVVDLVNDAIEPARRRSARDC